MQFPLRLTLELARARLSWFLPADSGGMILRVDPAEILHAQSAQPVSVGKIERILDAPQRIVWVGGSEPLAYSGIAHLVRSIAGRGQFVFLETDGILLRRRIHEFQPLPNLALVVSVDSCPAVAIPSGLVPNSHELAVEGVRAAQLFGFFTAIHSRVCAAPADSGWTRLAEFAAHLGLDGWLVTAATRDAAAQARDLRRLIPGAQWRAFSERLEHELLFVSGSGPQLPVRILQESATETSEESVGAS